MSQLPKIYGHRFAAFVWKVLIALYERDVPFDFLPVDPEHPENLDAISRLSPTGQFPVLVDGETSVIESAAIIEYLDLEHDAAAPMIPMDRRAAIPVRQIDGVFDDYVMAPLTRMVLNQIRPEDSRDPNVDEEMQALLDRSYAWLDGRINGSTWAAGETFSLADCAAAPALHYANWGYPIPARLDALHAYRRRLVARPSVARVIEEARPYRDLFPLKDRGTPN